MIGKRSTTLVIIGQGYVGLPLAMAAVQAGWKVIGIDISESKVAQINSGSSPVEDISDSLLSNAISSGTYNATTDFAVASQASIVAICVPTPLDSRREPDLSLLKDAITKVSPFVSDETLIVNESTSYPGTLRSEIMPLFETVKNMEFKKLYFASAPERVNPGDQNWNQRNTPRLVGGIDKESEDKAKFFYDSICDGVVLVSSPEVAEAAKLLENTFRLVNIALINEFTQICNSNGINAQEVIDAASSKPYGFLPFRPGVGVGGHCIPVDPLYLSWWARQNGKQATMVELADSVNLGMPKYVAELAIGMVDPTISKPRVLIIGVAYKSGVADIRETPAGDLYDQLQLHGAEVAWFDPLVPKWKETDSVDLSWECDVAILATRQPSMDLENFISKGIPVLDCTNSTDSAAHVKSL